MQTRVLELSDPVDKVVIHLDDDSAQAVGSKTFRKRILRYGQWNHSNAPGGVLNVDSDYCNQLIANFSSGVWDDVYVTLGHPKDDVDGLDKTVGAAVDLEHVAGDGIYALISVSEPAAAERISSRLIRGCSSGILPSYTDHRTDGLGEVGPVLAHIALTNEPYIKGLGEFETVALAEEAKSDGVLLDPVQPDPPTVPQEEQDMPMTREELIAAAKEEHGIDILGLEASATSVEELQSKLDEAEAALAAKPDEDQVRADAEKGLVAALGEALVTAEVITLSEGQGEVTQDQLVRAIATEIKAGRQSAVELAETRANAAIETAVREGRLAPVASDEKRDTLKKLWLSDSGQTFDALYDTQIVQMGEIGSSDHDVDLGEVDIESEVNRYSELFKEV